MLRKSQVSENLGRLLEKHIIKRMKIESCLTNLKPIKKWGIDKHLQCWISETRYDNIMKQINKGMKSKLCIEFINSNYDMNLLKGDKQDDK